MTRVKTAAHGMSRLFLFLLVVVNTGGCAKMNQPNASQRGSQASRPAQSQPHRYPYDIDPDRRRRIVEALQASYDRFDPTTFETDGQGHYPLLGPGRAQDTLGWLYPAMHLILEPRSGREAADRALGRKMVLRVIRQGQFRSLHHPADGTWYIYFHDAETSPPADRNMPGFMGCGLMRIWACDPRKMADWPAAEMAEFKEAVRASVEASERLPVRIGYANPQMLEFFLGWSAADLLGDPGIRDRTRQHLQAFLRYAATTDTFEEYVSPTYMAVNLSAATPLAWYTKGTPDEAITTDLLGRVWRQIGAAAHGPTEELCGPHARAYTDTTLEAADAMYAWLHLAAPDVFRLPAGDTTPTPIQIGPKMYDDLAAPGLYVPLQVPADVMRAFRERFETPVESHELLEWVGRCTWWPPYDLSRPDPSQPAPRFRLATRYRTNRFCLGSVNEQDAWLQRRSCLVYWKDAAGKTTGLKWHVVFEIDGAASDALGDWLFMESIELTSLQSGPRVIGVYRNTPIVPAKPGDVLACPARVHGPGKDDALTPHAPVAWLLGTHWRQSIEQPWRHQKVKRVFIGVTPIGAGRWERLDAAGTRWVFAENGIEAVIETPAGAKVIPAANRTANREQVNCLCLYQAQDIEWDWLNVPPVFTPFALSVQEQGQPRQFGLQATGGPHEGYLRKDDLSLKWLSPSRPDRATDRSWWGWIGGKEVLPAGYAR
jgi:hypothetical protein